MMQKGFLPEGVLAGTVFMFFICAAYTQNILKPETQTLDWWAIPPVGRLISIYVYNVTNVDNFLNNATIPILDELGPYVYQEKWERINITFNENGTVSYNLKKLYYFNQNLSVGMEEDVVVVPNIPLLRSTSLAKYSFRFFRRAMSSIVDILQLKPFIELSIGELLWGYEDALLKLNKDLASNMVSYPDEEFGLMYKKNGTLEDRVSIFTGAKDITKYGLIDTFNGRSHQTHWLTDKCNSLLASDGSLFPPNITKNTTLYLYNKDLCRTLPLVFEREIKREDNIPCWRFSPPTNVFDSVEKNPENECYCPGGPPCLPSGLSNVSFCQYGTPLMLSFPHFYLADDSLRNALDGISLSDPERDKFYLDVQPDTGFTMSAKERMQFNLAVSQVPDVKAVEKFPDIVFPIFWFEESVNDLPEEITKFINDKRIPSQTQATLTEV